MPPTTPPPPSPRKAGHPKLDPAIATRLRSICFALLHERFGGNVPALARALDRTSSSFLRLLDGQTDPSYETITRIAQLLQVDISEICRIPPEGPESSVLPSPRTQTLSAVYVMAQGARFDDAFIQQWHPADPQERDPDKLWSECKEAHRVWKERRGDGGEKERRRLIRLYFRQVQAFGQRLAERLEAPSDKDLQSAVKQVYLESSIPPELVLSFSVSTDDAYARHPHASPLVLAEYCFRQDIIDDARERMTEMRGTP